MNRKGQVLVGFVLLLPLIIMLFAYVIDNGVLIRNKNKLDELTRTVVTYALEHREKTESELKEYIRKNESNLDQIEIYLDEDVQIHLVKTVDAIFGNAIGIKQYTISSYYIGEQKEGEIILRKVEKE